MTDIRTILTETPTETTLLAALVDNDVDAVVAAMAGLDLSEIDVDRLLRASDVTVDFDVDWEDDGGYIYAVTDVVVEAHGKTLGTIKIPVQVEWYAYESRSVVAYEGQSGTERVSGLFAALERDARTVAVAAYGAIDFGGVPDADESEDGEYLLVETDGHGEVARPVVVLSRHATSLGAAIAAMGQQAMMLVIKSADVEVERDEDGDLIATEYVRTHEVARLKMRSAVVNDALSCPYWATMAATTFLMREAA